MLDTCSFDNVSKTSDTLKRSALAYCKNKVFTDACRIIGNNNKNFICMILMRLDSTKLYQTVVYGISLWYKVKILLQMVKANM